MLKVSEKDLSFLTPDSRSQETYPGKVERFLKDKGYTIPALTDKQNLDLKDAALSYWRDHKHENLTEAAWLYAYCSVLKIDLDLHLKR